jgi:hypothetical protein
MYEKTKGMKVEPAFQGICKNLGRTPLELQTSRNLNIFSLLRSLNVLHGHPKRAKNVRFPFAEW